MTLADAIMALSVSLPAAAFIWKMVPTRDLLIRQQLTHIESKLDALGRDVDEMRAEIIGLYAK